MIWYKVTVFFWTAISIVYSGFAIFFFPNDYQNFTTWVFWLQTIFFSIEGWRLMENTTISSAYTFLYYGIFFPCLLSWEISTGASVVYMMTEHATVFQESIDEVGEELTWIGNFFVHYLTLIMLIIFIAHEKCKWKDIKMKMNTQNYDYINLLIILSFTVMFTYMTIYNPANHYGIKNIDKLPIFVGVIFSGMLGLYIFYWFLQKIDQI